MKMSQYCSVCKAEYEMDVVPTSDDDGVLWLQCPVCKGYLPKVKSASGEEVKTVEAAEEADESPFAPETPEQETTKKSEEPEVAPEESGAAETVAEAVPEAASEKSPEPVVDADEGAEELAAMDVDKAVAYRPWQSYEVGDVVKHLAWDDYGVVLAKEILPGQRRVVKVRFQDAGLVRLREDDGA